MIDGLLKSKLLRRLRLIAIVLGVLMVIGGIGEAFSGKPSGIASAILGAFFVSSYWLLPSPEKVDARRARKLGGQADKQAQKEAERRQRQGQVYAQDLAQRQAAMHAQPALLLQAYREKIASYQGTVPVGLLDNFNAAPTIVYAPTETHVLALGPPRSGKTSTLVIPAILSTERPLVSTSTKDEVMRLTAGARQQLGRVWLFDPSSSVESLPAVTRIRWSPVQAAKSWDEAQPAGHLLLEAARGSSGGVQNEGFWRERAGSILGPLLLAANVSGGSMRQVMKWVNQRDLEEAMDILHKADAETAYSVLIGIERTEQKELSGVFSTLASALSAYSRDTVLRSTDEPNFDPKSFPASSDTIYLCSPGDDQKALAPLMVLFLDGLRQEIYRAHRRGEMTQPALFMLDEVANIAPIPNLPNILSEAASQGLQVVACLQDLSQARQIWEQAGEGLLTMFQMKLIFSGISDQQTLELLSKIAGEYDERVLTSGETQSISEGGYGGQTSSSGTSSSEQIIRKERWPVSAIAHQQMGTVLCYAKNGVFSMSENAWYKDDFLSFLVAETKQAMDVPADEASQDTEVK